jgi:hypothetical protein
MASSSRSMHPTELPSWPPLNIFAGHLMQLEEDLRAGFPDELLPDPSPAFARTEFMVGNPFHGGVVGYQQGRAQDFRFGYSEFPKDKFLA